MNNIYLERVELVGEYSKKKKKTSVRECNNVLRWKLALRFFICC
jgi:hypothetical protein